MPLVKATLIQDIIEFFVELDPHLSEVLPKMNFMHMTLRRDLVLWIIREELEVIYGLFTKGHIHNQYPYAVYHAKLAKRIDLSRLVWNHIKALAVNDDDCEVTIRLNNNDLFIYYYSDKVGSSKTMIDLFR